MKNMTTSSIFVLFVLAMGTVAAPAAFADHSEVTIRQAEGSSLPGCEETEDGCFIPKIATVDVGGTVIIANTDNVAHTATSGSLEDGPSGHFDSGLAMPGTSYEWSPTEVGEYPYYCIVHPWMSGLIIVQEKGADSDNDTGMKDEMHAHDEMDAHDKMDSHDGMDMMMADIPEGVPSGEGMIMEDETTVKIWTTEATEGEQMEITVMLQDREHVNYDLVVMQNDETVLTDEGAHSHTGMHTHSTAPLPSGDPVDVMITFQGYGIDEITGPVGSEVVFTQVVPEFGTIAMMVLVVATISIIAVTAKSRVIPRI